MIRMNKSFCLEERLDYLKEYGNHSMSYSTLQKGMEHFDISGIGYLSYMKKNGSSYVLANPICDVSDREKLVGEFLYKNPKTAFVQITGDVANMLNQGFNFYATQIGIESWFDLTKWDVKGKRKLIRKYRNKAEKLGITLKKIDDNEEEVLKNQIDTLKDKWRKDRRTKNNICFLVRPEENNEPYTIKYGSFIDNKLIGYVVCDPLWWHNSIQGYNINLTFYDAEAFKGLNYFNVSEILFDLKNQGYEKATLGYSPLRDIKKTGFDNPGLVPCLQLLYDYGNSIYNFKGLARHKKDYYPEEIDVFYSSKKAVAFYDLFNVLKISRLI